MAKPLQSTPPPQLFAHNSAFLVPNDFRLDTIDRFFHDVGLLIVIYPYRVGASSRI